VRGRAGSQCECGWETWSPRLGRCPHRCARRAHACRAAAVERAAASAGLGFECCRYNSGVRRNQPASSARPENRLVRRMRCYRERPPFGPLNWQTVGRLIKHGYSAIHGLATARELSQAELSTAQVLSSPKVGRAESARSTSQVWRQRQARAGPVTAVCAPRAGRLWVRKGEYPVM
jgi:hypothetical protein